MPSRTYSSCYQVVWPEVARISDCDQKSLNTTDLLEDEHVVVEELLQLLVAEVDADLLEGVELEDLEAGDVEHADEVDLWWIIIRQMNYLMNKWITFDVI